MSEAFCYCRDYVRQGDPDRFLLSLFAPIEGRDALWALFAFNLEIAKTREVVSETQLGLIRLQWWREEIGRIYDEGAPREHEVLQALASIIKRYDLPRAWFEDLIYGREFDLEGILPETLDGTVRYVEHTNVPLMKLVAKIVGADPDSEAVARVAVNYGLIGVLRAVPFHAYQDRCYLPADLLKEYKISEYALFKGRDVEKIIPVVQAVLERFKRDVTPDRRFLKATQALADIYYVHLDKNGCDVFMAINKKPPLFKELRVFARACF